jgi:RND family efflux transporter MFP subunit
MRLMTSVLLSVVTCGVVFAQSQDAPPLLTITTVRPVSQTLEENLTLACQTVARHDILVNSDVTGVRITVLHAEPGDDVRQGQILAELDTEGLRLQLKQLGSLRERAEEEYTRIRSMAKGGAASVDAVSEKRLALESARAQYDELALKLTRARITAPGNGRIYDRHVEAGSWVTGNEPLFRLARDAAVEAECRVPESQAIRVSKGQSVQLQLQGQALPVTGSVRALWPWIDPQTRTARLRVHLPDTDWRPIGEYVHGTLVVARHTGLTLPNTALQVDRDGDYVWHILDNLARRVAIVRRFHNEQFSVVEFPSIPGIADIPVAARAGAFLQEGARVEVTGGP